MSMSVSLLSESKGVKVSNVESVGVSDVASLCASGRLFSLLPCLSPQCAYVYAYVSRLKKYTY
jgi:hypothetical protein